MSKFTNRKGKIRLYDGTGTPWYLEFDFDNGDISFPAGQPGTEEILVLPRGTMGANAHYIEGPDDPMLAPVDFSFSAMLTDTTHTKNILDWLSGGTVNAHVTVTTKATTQRDGATANPAFSAATGTKKCFNVEYLLDGAADLKWVLAEVNFPLDQQSIAESADGVNISLKGKVYGTIVLSTGAFTSGTDVEA